MCFGVRDAIGLALETAAHTRLTVLGELVHNESVLGSLRRQGVAIEHQLDAVTTPTVMITAHGASEVAMNRARARGLNVLEATCPLVHHAHQAVRKLVRDGYHPVIIGKRDHVEVRGITEDLVACDVILSEADLEQVQERPRFGVAAQTTQPIQHVRRLVSLLELQFPHSEVRFADTVCRPTKQRQAAAVDLARRCDVVVIIGGANSNNTKELVATCSRFCRLVYHVQNGLSLREDWFTRARTVGISAGTSTPDSVIDEVEARLEEIASCLAAQTANNTESALISS